MFCKNCGNIIADNSKFCSQCGCKVEAPMSDTIDNLNISKTTVNKNSQTTNQYKKVFLNLIHLLKEKFLLFWNNLTPYGKLITVVVSIFASFALVALLFNKIYACIIASVQIILAFIALLIKKQIIKTSKPRLHIIVLLLSVAMIFPYIDVFRGNLREAEKFKWSDFVLSDVIPKPKSNWGVLSINSDNRLNLYVYNTDAEQFKKYVQKCKKEGFNINLKEYDGSFSADSQDGYELSVYLFEDDEKMHITLSAPQDPTISITTPTKSAIEATTEPTTVSTTEPTTEPTIEPTTESTTAPTEPLQKLKWPNNPLAKLIPVPNSKYGTIQHSNEDELELWIDLVNQEDFDTYISKCVNKGFSVIQVESSYEFKATNKNGYRLSLRLYDDGMKIIVAYPLYSVQLTLNCIPNLFFNKYDVDVILDRDKLTSVVHGQKTALNLNLDKGTHTLEIIRSGWKAPAGKIDFKINGDAIITYDISCGDDAISLTKNEHIDLRALTDKEARVPSSASDLKYDNYNDVINSLKESGFTNIKTAILYDIVLGWTSEGEVDSVSIAGISDFSNGAIFKKNDEVIVTYHMPEDDDPARIKMTQSAKTYEGKNYSEVEKALKKLGFSNIILEQETTTDSSYNEGEVYRVTIDYEHFEIGDAYLPNDKVLIKYYSIDQTAKSSNETMMVKDEQTSNTQKVILPPSDSKLAKDFDSEGQSTIYYINVDDLSNTPTLKKWGRATVTDGVAEYLDYLKSLGFNISITKSEKREPYSGFHIYDTNFKASNSDLSWTMYLSIQDEDYVEYEFGINLP